MLLYKQRTHIHGNELLDLSVFIVIGKTNRDSRSMSNDNDNNDDNDKTLSNFHDYICIMLHVTVYLNNIRMFYEKYVFMYILYLHNTLTVFTA